MRKFFLGAALVAASFGMAQSADAATVMDVDGVSTVLAISDYEGTYNGTMDQIKMRGEDYEPRAASYTLENGILSCDFPQIGSMPGDYKTSKLYKQNEKVILFIQPSYGNSNRIKFV